jgi:hypothetical protein
LVVAVQALAEPIVALETVEIRQVEVAQGKAGARREVAKHRVEVAMVSLGAAAQERVEATTVPGKPVPRARGETRLVVTPSPRLFCRKRQKLLEC